MVEFIVLGVVPGTQLEINFTHVATVAWLGFITYCAYSSKRSADTNDN